MKTTRRMKRMSRNRAQVTKMNLTSLMDVFTILVFFLLVNSGSPGWVTSYCFSASSFLFNTCSG